MKFSQLGFNFQSWDRLAKFWSDNKNRKRKINTLKVSLKGKIWTENSVERLIDWCPWVKIFLFFVKFYWFKQGLIKIVSKISTNHKQLSCYFIGKEIISFGSNAIRQPTCRIWWRTSRRAGGEVWSPSARRKTGDNVIKRFCFVADAPILTLKH